MSWEAWLTCLTVVVMFVALVRNWAPADLVLMAALTLLVLAGELFDSRRLPSAAEAVAGLGNSGFGRVRRGPRSRTAVLAPPEAATRAGANERFGEAQFFAQQFSKVRRSRSDAVGTSHH